MGQASPSPSAKAPLEPSAVHYQLTQTVVAESKEASTGETNNKTSTDSKNVIENISLVTNTPPKPSYDEEQLVAMARDLYLSGADTTPSALSWIFLYMQVSQNAKENARRDR